MSESILKEKQLKKALRNKKNNKQTIKNVLSAPEELNWPILKGNDLNVLKNALETYLPQIRPQKVSIKYFEIKDIKKEERKAYRLKKTEFIKCENNDREVVTFGLNQVNRLVVNKNASFVLISSNVSPRFILECLIRDCTFYNIPYLLLPDLKGILEKRCGIKSMIIGFKNCIKSSSNLNLLKKTFEDVYKNYDFNLKSKQSDIIISNKDIEINKEATEVKVEELQVNFEPDDVYLRRKDCVRRVFQPSSCCVMENKKEEMNRNDFIGFGESNVVETTIKYKPLVVKRVKSDPDRSKKKFKKSK